MSARSFFNEGYENRCRGYISLKLARWLRGGVTARTVFLDTGE